MRERAVPAPCFHNGVAARRAYLTPLSTSLLPRNVIVDATLRLVLQQAEVWSHPAQQSSDHDSVLRGPSDTPGCGASVKLSVLDPETLKNSIKGTMDKFPTRISCC